MPISYSDTPTSAVYKRMKLSRSRDRCVMHICSFVIFFFISRAAGAGWNIGRRMHHAPAVAATAGARAAPLHAASTARGGGAASSALRMVATEPAIQPVRCVGCGAPDARKCGVLWESCVACCWGMRNRAQSSALKTLHADGSCCPAFGRTPWPLV